VNFSVIDASALVAFYVSDDPRRDGVAEQLRSGQALFAPAHLDAEVTSALRGLARGNHAVRSVAPEALRHLSGFPIRRMPLAPLLQRMWQLRDNMTAYDAAYIALAERLPARLVTCDAKLAGASGSRCSIELVS
jgi:predicted nucleic acid-binding protein